MGPFGGATGAVYTVVIWYPAVAGLNEPHALAGAQLHVTPALALSFNTFAAMAAVPPAVTTAGGACTICTVRAPEVVPGGLSYPLPQAQRNARVRMTRHKTGTLQFIVHLGLKRRGKSCNLWSLWS